jgi:thiol:disulfide interchange protein DsbC
MASGAHCAELFYGAEQMKNLQKKTFMQILSCGALLLASTFGYYVMAQSSPANSEDQALLEKLSKALGAASQGQLQAVAVRKSAMPGLLEVELNSGELLLSDAGGDFLLTGDLYRTTETGLQNLSAENRKGKVVEMIAAIPEAEMIIYNPRQQKASITVFTDADCTYCRKLHADMDEILERGIQVRYMAFPRGGSASTVFPKMISIWCAQDRNEALDQAKRGQNLPERSCDNPVLKHFELGNQIGISGTPALVLKDGTVIPGYLDVERLAEVVLGSQ